MTGCVGVFEAKFTLQLIAPYSIVRTALARGSTSRSHTSNMVLAQLAERVWWTKFQSSLLNIYFRLSEFQAPLLLIYFRNVKKTIRYVTLHLEIGAAHLRSITEIAAPQSFLCVNRRFIRYDFSAGAKAVSGIMNTRLRIKTKVRFPAQGMFILESRITNILVWTFSILISEYAVKCYAPSHSYSTVNLRTNWSRKQGERQIKWLKIFAVIWIIAHLGLCPTSDILQCHNQNFFCNHHLTTFAAAAISINHCWWPTKFCPQITYDRRVLYGPRRITSPEII